MAGFFQDVASSFFGSEYLRDYTHASKTFRPNAYQYAPKFKFLFHVYFDINPSAYRVGLTDDANFGLAVKTAKLPNYTFDTHTMNQYNRKRIVQTKIKYDPIDITFHDDNGGASTSPTGGGMIRNMWYNYYTYYYKDASKPIVSISGKLATTTGQAGINPSTASAGTGYNTRNIYADSITGNTDWGYIGETGNTNNPPEVVAVGQTKVPFFKNITIFGFNQRNYVAYTLINPIITRFAHDTYNYAEGNGTMENSMTIDYETVKYFTGAMDGKNPSDTVPGFGLDSHFDRTLSPIARPGSQSTILGQGGLIDGILGGAKRDPVTGAELKDAKGNIIYNTTGFIQDLSSGNALDVLNGIQKAGTTYNTLKNMNLKQAVRSEITVGITNALMNPLNNTGRNLLFNTPIWGKGVSLTNKPVSGRDERTTTIT